MKKSILSIICGILLLPAMAQHPDFIISAPAQFEFTGSNSGGMTVIPNGRFITPEGKCFNIAPHPYGIAISNDGSVAVTANSGTSPLIITILRNLRSDEPEIQQVPPGPATDKGVLASVFMGIAISPDNKFIYVAGGQENKIFIFDVASGAKTGEISCSYSDAKSNYLHGYLGDLVLSRDGNWLYAVDQIGFRVVVIDMRHNKLVASIAVGRYPFGICLSPDEKQVFVANVWMYRYGKIRKNVKGKLQNGLLDFPAFAYGTKEAEEGFSFFGSI